MSLLSLNFDVLETILSFVEPRDALPLMTTCCALHVPAMRRHLFEITLRWGDYRECRKTVKFCEYMLGDLQVRARCLGALNLFPQSRRPPAVPISDHLAEIIRHATGLRRIVLNADDYFLESCPTLVDALADVESLKTIRFNSSLAAARGVALLSRMKSQLRSVQCMISLRAILPPLGPTPFLHNFVQSLTFLDIHGVLDILVVDTEPHVVWPRVQELTLRDAKIKHGHWQFICRAFPSLRTLRMGGTLLDTSGACAEWSEMDLVQTRSPLALRCHVRCVELHANLEDRRSMPSQHNVADYLEMLGHASPVALTCRLNHCIMDYVPVRLHRLRFLHLETYDLVFSRELSSIARWINAALLHLASSLAQSRVRAVIIKLPHNCAIKRAELRSHAENIALHARCMDLIGLHRHGLQGSMGDMRSWRYSLCNWYHVTSRTADGTPHLSRVSEEDVPELVPLIQSCKVLE